MTRTDLEQLGDAIIESARQAKGVENTSGLLRATIKLLAKGEPVPIDDIAAAAGRPRAEVLAALRAYPPLEWGSGETIVGLGLTLNPTRHRIEVAGKQLFAWCALDTLVVPRILGAEARVESPCAATSTPIRLEVTPEYVRSAEPETSVVSVVVPEAHAENLRAAFCERVLFFKSADAAAPWLGRHPGARLVPVREAVEFSRVFERLERLQCCE